MANKMGMGGSLALQVSDSKGTGFKEKYSGGSMIKVSASPRTYLKQKTKQQRRKIQKRRTKSRKMLMTLIVVYLPGDDLRTKKCKS